MPFRDAAICLAAFSSLMRFAFYVHLLDDIGIIADWVRNAGVDQVL